MRVSVSSICRALVAAFFLLCAAAVAWSQATNTGTVAGQVVDPSNAVVAGATVTLTDIATGKTHTATTNDAGRYIFVNVPIGTYDINVSKEGFSQAKVLQQSVDVGLTTTVNVGLKLGAATETVTVEATGAALQTMNATVGTTIGFQNLQEMPNLGRDASTLVELQPGISSNGSTAGTVRDQNTFQLDGGNNSNDMDGTMNTYTPSYASNGGPTGVMPTPVESIEEFKVNVANQTADFNGSAGAQIQMATRRGGQAWHGAVYEFYSGSNFYANSWQNNHTPLRNSTGQVVSPTTPLPSNHYNRFGASGGGPVGPRFLGGKTYLFMNYEGRRFPQNNTVDKVVPSAALRAGVVQIQNAAGTFVPYNLNPFPVTVPGINNGQPLAPAACPASPNGLCDPRGIGINPLVSQLWNNYMPAGNDFSGAAGDGFNTVGYLTGLKTPQNDNIGVLRLDHDFGSKWHFMGSYRYYRLDLASNVQYDVGGLIAGKLGVATSTASRPQLPWYYVAGVTTNISNNLTNDFHYSFLRNWWQWISAGGAPQFSQLSGAMEIGGETANALIPYNVNTQNARQRYWNGHDNMFRDDMTYLRGNHLLQWGGTVQHDWDAHQRNDNGLGIMEANVYQMGASSTTSLAVTGLCVSNSCSAGDNAYVPAGIPTSNVNTYRNYYAQVLGIVTQSQSVYPRSSPDLALQSLGTPVVAHVVTPSYNAYMSDSWHLKPSITLTYGLSYFLQMPPYELDGKQVLLVDQSGNPVYASNYLAAMKNAALAGQTYDPTLGFEAIRNIKGRKYPYDPFYGGVSPRVAAAWNPHFGDGLLGKITGGDKTVLRGGFSRIYGRLNGVANILTPLLAPGLLQALQCDGVVTAANAVNGSQCLGPSGATPLTAFRLGKDGNTAPLPTPVANLPQPYLPGVGQFLTTPSGDALALDPAFRPNTVDSIDVTLQRQVSNKMFVEMGYIGRLINHELIDLDINAVPYMMTLGGQSYADAFGKLYTSVCGLSSPTCATSAAFGSKSNPAQYTGPVEPFFETALGGAGSAYCTGFTSCTAAEASKLYSNYATGQAYTMWASMSAQKSWILGRTIPASNPPGGCVSGASICTQFPSMATSMSTGSSNYHAGFVSFTLRDWHGMTGTSNFTWSHALGMGATTQSSSGYTVMDPWNLRAMYGEQFFDTKFLFNQGLSYHPPFFKNQPGIVGRLLGGWGVAPLFTAQSGLPLEVNIAGDCQSFGESSCDTSTNENAVLLGSAPSVSSHYGVTSSGSAGKTGNINSSCIVNGAVTCGGIGMNAFADPQAVYNSFRRLVLGVDTAGGGAGRIRGFARWNLDLQMTKDTKFTERYGATFYATFVNVMNHFQPADPPMNIDSSIGNWGLINAQATGYPSRQMEFGVRIHW